MESSETTTQQANFSLVQLCKGRKIEVALLGVLAVALSYLSFFYGQIESLQVFGSKTNSLFDLWSLQHFMAGAVFVFFLKAFTTIPKRNVLIYVLLAAVTWELLEVFMETGALGSWLFQWKAGVESPYNRLLADPLLAFLGALAAERLFKYRKLLTAAALSFLVLNLLMPDAMYIHEFLFT